jgi:hypothetical protein
MAFLPSGWLRRGHDLETLLSLTVAGAVQALHLIPVHLVSGANDKA